MEVCSGCVIIFSRDMAGSWGDLLFYRPSNISSKRKTELGKDTSRWVLLCVEGLQIHSPHFLFQRSMDIDVWYNGCVTLSIGSYLGWQNCCSCSFPFKFVYLYSHQDEDKMGTHTHTHQIWSVPATMDVTC